MTSSPDGGSRNNGYPASAANDVEYFHNPSEDSSHGFHPAKGTFFTTQLVDLIPNQSNITKPQSRNGDLYGEPPEGAPVSTVRPPDEGFGAWSYAVSAFAMFIVVWGE
jgi:hypothetical protein